MYSYICVAFPFFHRLDLLNGVPPRMRSRYFEAEDNRRNADEQQQIERCRHNTMALSTAFMLVALTSRGELILQSESSYEWMWILKKFFEMWMKLHRSFPISVFGATSNSQSRSSL